jgi:hypothetical protein
MAFAAPQRKTGLGACRYRAMLERMIALLLLLGQTAPAPPAERLAGHFYAAIWNDLQLNAAIGNGNWIASLWYQAGSGTAADLHIQDLKCRKRGWNQDCSFILFRDVRAEEKPAPEAAPVRLTCTARLRSNGSRWRVVHTPPVDGGHSRTSMACAEA